MTIIFRLDVFRSYSFLFDFGISKKNSWKMWESTLSENSDNNLDLFDSELHETHFHIFYTLTSLLL